MMMMMMMEIMEKMMAPFYHREVGTLILRAAPPVTGVSGFKHTTTLTLLHTFVHFSTLLHIFTLLYTFAQFYTFVTV